MNNATSAIRSYPGHTKEAWLWLILLGGLSLSTVLLVALHAFGVSNPLQFQYPAGSIRSYADLVILGIISAIMLRAAIAIARWRGTEVEVYSDRIEVKEWYGHKRSLSLQHPISVKAGIPIYIFGTRRFYFPLEWAKAALLTAGNDKTCVNLEAFSDICDEADDLGTLLLQLTG